MSICVRAGDLPLLGRDLEMSIDALPFEVEGEAWTLMRPLHRLAGIDAATSVPTYSPPGSDQLLWYEWINAVDPQAERAMIFGTRPDGGVTWVTEAFVQRVKAAGLEGLRFVHAGYLVPDLAQARPRPAPRPRAARTAPEPPPARLSALDEATRSRLEQLRSRAAQVLPVAATASADACVDLLDDWLQAGHRAWKRLDEASRRQRIDTAAVVFGDLLCRELGWQWSALQQGDEGPWLAIASTDRSCAIPVQAYVERQLKLTERTLRLAFNMLRAGQLPSAPAGGLTVLC